MSRCECLDVEKCHLYTREKDGATSGRCPAEATTTRYKIPYCQPCADRIDRQTGHVPTLARQVDGSRYPAWLAVDSFQRDHTAEAAGY